MNFCTYVEEEVARTEKYFKSCVSLSLPSYNCLELHKDRYIYTPCTPQKGAVNF